MKGIVSAFLFILSSVTIAQTGVSLFDRVSQNELTMKSYEPDKNAPAVVLFDLGKAVFVQTENGFEINFTRKTRIKIFSKEGFSFANIEIPLYTTNTIFERVTHVEATSYSMVDGRCVKTPLDPALIYTDELDDRWTIKKFAIPMVREGSVIEYTYTIETPVLFNLPDWEFQWDIPVVYSEYLVKMIPFYEYTYLLQGANSFSEFESYIYKGIRQSFAGIQYQELVYRFAMKDLPAFKEEEYITSRKDCIIKLDFQLAKIHRPDGAESNVASTWTELNTELLSDSNFGGFLKASEKQSKELLAQISLPSDIPDKISALVNLTKSMHKWNGRDAVFTKVNVKKFLELATGNVAEINLFLTGFLKASGLEAYPVVLSTRDHGKIIDSYPFLDMFNYVIAAVRVENGYILVDATNPISPFDMIPSRCINNQGLIVKKTDAEWIPLYNSQFSILRDSISMVPDSLTNSWKVDFEQHASGYFAINHFGSYSENSWLQEMETRGYSDIRILNKPEAVNDIDTFSIAAQFNIPFEKISGEIIVFPFLNQVIKENPFRQSNREYPIDMNYLRVREFISTIEIPKGFMFTNLPDSIFASNKYYELKYSVRNKSCSHLEVKAFYKFKKVIYEPREYNILKSLHADVIKKFNQRIMIVPILTTSQD